MYIIYTNIQNELHIIIFKILYVLLVLREIVYIRPWKKISDILRRKMK
jgi:hypothetical protein